MLKLLKQVDKSNICRICLLELDGMKVNIFDMKHVVNECFTPIFIKIMACAAVQIKKTEASFPDAICGKCSKTLDEMCKFRELIEFSDAKLRKLASTKDREIVKVETSPPGESSSRCRSEKASNIKDSILETYNYDHGDQSDDVTPDENVENDATVKSDRDCNEDQHTSDVITCPICSKVCKSSSSLNSHKRIHGGSPFKCGECGKIFAYRGLLTQHMLTHRSDRSFLCAVCGKSFKTKAQMKVHARRHSDDRPFPCRFCEKRFYQASHRNQHMRLHTGEMPYSCHICGKHFRNQTGLKGHLRRHDGTLPFSCEICGKKFALKSSLNNHSRLHFGEKPYRCEACDKSFALSSSLRVHMRIHSEETSSVCDTCGKRFPSIRHLTDHAKIHLEGKNCVCVTCGKAYKQPAGLTMHMKTHNRGGPFKCDLCNKSFLHFHTFEIHYKRHSGAKNFICRTCGKSFRENTSLETHQCNEKSFECDFCQLIFPDKSFLDEHMKMCSHLKPQNILTDMGQYF